MIRSKSGSNVKMQILVDAKKLLSYLLPALQRMPKIERIEGAGQEMKKASFAIISDFTVAYFCQEYRTHYLRKLFGDYALLQVSFEIALSQGIIEEKFKLPIAECMEKIDNGIRKWYNSIKK